MTSPFHHGELAVQARAGVQHNAARIGKGIGVSIPDAARLFVEQQPFAVAASVDPHGCVWASLLTGAPGFMRALDEHTLRIAAAPAPGDPLAANIPADDRVGLIVIDLATRRRMRLNGTAAVQPDGALLVRAAQVYANCPKYIQARTWQRDDALSTQGASHRRAALTAAQLNQIAAADTFFIASAAPGSHLDASHRGGNPGFVHVLDDRTLLFPDYAGNTMFNTLGNLAANPHAGLLFIDFERGGVLQLTGTAEILWDGPSVHTLPGAERAVRFTLDEAIETTTAHPLRWRFVDHSPFNPA